MARYLTKLVNKMRRKTLNLDTVISTAPSGTVLSVILAVVDRISHSARFRRLRGSLLPLTLAVL